MRITKYVLVTGGAGFLGSNLCKHLLKDEQVHVFCVDNLITGNTSNLAEIIDNPRFSFYEYDITHRNATNDLRFVWLDEIYHLACIASPPKYKAHSLETLNTSIQGTKNMLEVARLTGAKLLFSSTSEVYGDPLVHPQSEDYFGNVNTVGERSCYDEGKRVAETFIYEYRRLYGIDAKIVRIFNTYGPFMDIDDGRVITNFIKQIKSGQPLLIHGDGSQTRSFCYVDDMIDGLCKMMASDQKGPINIGNPFCEFTLNDLVSKFEACYGKKLEVAYIDSTENDPKQRKPDISKASELLNWSPSISLEDGIQKTIDYFTSFLV
jgi:UDP-glucuronate decarboxylase